MEKYFYIAVPANQFDEVKHTYYEAPSTFLHVYNGDHIADLESQLSTVQQQNKQMRTGLEKAEYDFRHIHARYGNGEMGGGDVIQYSADSGKRVFAVLQSLQDKT